MQKRFWSPDEDEKLSRCIAMYVKGCWNDIARKAGLQRSGKSCRRRWMNHLRPDLNRGGFTATEINRVLALQRALGNRWSVIAGHLVGRTDNDVKNLWNTQIKRRINQQLQQRRPDEAAASPASQQHPPHVNVDTNALCVAVLSDDSGGGSGARAYHVISYTNNDDAAGYDSHDVLTKPPIWTVNPQDYNCAVVHQQQQPPEYPTSAPDQNDNASETVAILDRVPGCKKALDVVNQLQWLLAVAPLYMNCTSPMATDEDDPFENLLQANVPQLATHQYITPTSNSLMMSSSSAALSQMAAGTSSILPLEELALTCSTEAAELHYQGALMCANKAHPLHHLEYDLHTVAVNLLPENGSRTSTLISPAYSDKATDFDCLDPVVSSCKPRLQGIRETLQMQQHPVDWTSSSPAHERYASYTTDALLLPVQPESRIADHEKIVKNNQTDWKPSAEGDKYNIDYCNPADEHQLPAVNTDHGAVSYSTLPHLLGSTTCPASYNEDDYGGCSSSNVW